MKHTYLSEAIAALEDLGGQAHISEIFNKIAERNNLDFSHAKTPKQTLQKTLQINRADHPKSESNTFYSIYGLKLVKVFGGLLIMRSLIIIFLMKLMQIYLLMKELN